MRTLAVVNQKGGCGKTTIAVNLAACIAASGERVLLVDMDPQGHASVSLGIAPDSLELTVYNTLTDDKEDSFPVFKVLLGVDDNLWLVPADIQLSIMEDQLAGAMDGRDRLRTCLFEASPYYDFCIIDCPPNMGMLTMNALRAAQAALIPFDMNPLSLHGVRNLLEMIEYLRTQTGHSVRARIVANMFEPRTNISRILLSTLREDFGDHLCAVKIHRTIKLTEAAMQGMPVRKFAPYSLTHEDFADLALEIAEDSDLFATPIQFPARVLFSYFDANTSVTAAKGGPGNWRPAEHSVFTKPADRKADLDRFLMPGNRHLEFIIARHCRRVSATPEWKFEKSGHRDPTFGGIQSNTNSALPK
jgi:chromosome partitioning protein